MGKEMMHDDDDADGEVDDVDDDLDDDWYSLMDSYAGKKADCPSGVLRGSELCSQTDEFWLFHILCVVALGEVCRHPKLWVLVPYSVLYVRKMCRHNGVVKAMVWLRSIYICIFCHGKEKCAFMMVWTLWSY